MGILNHNLRIDKNRALDPIGRGGFYVQKITIDPFLHVEMAKSEGDFKLVQLEAVWDLQILK